ncbi:MAG: YqhV family protein [Firmicutes bacterium]|nr:YqhV family protein [Bacillota bacterium]
MEEIVLKNMALIRVISGLIEIIAALLFLKAGRVNIALRMNAFLGLIGPLVFILVSVLGLAVIAVKLSWAKVVIICLGLILVLVGTKM